MVMVDDFTKQKSEVVFKMHFKPYSNHDFLILSIKRKLFFMELFYFQNMEQSLSTGMKWKKKILKNPRRKVQRPI